MLSLIRTLRLTRGFMSAKLKSECFLIDPTAEPDNILLGVTLNPTISLVTINGTQGLPIQLFIKSKYVYTV